nr:MAG TPA_asm: hypothetical protein [Bacteriophage sp.]
MVLVLAIILYSRGWLDIAFNYTLYYHWTSSLL